MKRFYLIALSLLLNNCVFGQSALVEKTNIRLWEHHSSGVNGGKPFGHGAKGNLCGYDLMNNKHYPSFDTATMGKWGPNQYINIDLVEHNGPYGKNKPFGFTSAVSTIWAGDIRGNSQTVFMEAPASFNYDTVTSANTIKKAFDSTKASSSVNEVVKGKIYLARVRNSNRYIAMKITDVKNITLSGLGPNDTASVYFDFNYKYGDYSPVSIANTPNSNNTLTISPNPSRDNFTLSFNATKELTFTIKIYNQTGQMIRHYPIASTIGQNSIKINTSDFPAALYFVELEGDNGRTIKSLIKE